MSIIDAYALLNSQPQKVVDFDHHLVAMPGKPENVNIPAPELRAMLAMLIAVSLDQLPEEQSCQFHMGRCKH